MLYVEPNIKDIEMDKELAKTLTLALVNYIDENRPEGTMDCSSGECVSLEKAFTEENFDSVETLINKKLSRLTEFQDAVRVMITKALTTHSKYGNGREMSCTVFIDDDTAILLSSELLELAKKQLLSYADESNPVIEAMADLKRTYFNNPEKLPKWLKDDIARRELNAHTKGYNKGYEVASKLHSAPSFIPYSPLYQGRPLCWEPGGTCTNPQMDCFNCPRKTTGGGFSTSSGTSTATLHGNTSVTDGKEHNPSFTD